MNIDLEYRKGVLFLRLNGKLNKKTSFILEDAIKKIIKKAGIKYLLINFEKLYEIDNYGISTIINSYNQYIKDKGKLIICGYDNNIKLSIEKSDLLFCASVTQNELSVFNLVNI